MPLLNYTTNTPASTTVGEIQAMLARAGASKVMVDYEQGTGYILAITFQLILNGQPVSFRLPTDWKPVMQVLEDQKKKSARSGKRWRFAIDQEHALNVAWRIVKDWIEAQLAIVETRMVTPEQVFLPYAIVKGGKTLYESIKDGSNLLEAGE